MSSELNRPGRRFVASLPLPDLHKNMYTCVCDGINCPVHLKLGPFARSIYEYVDRCKQTYHRILSAYKREYVCIVYVCECCVYGVLYYKPKNAIEVWKPYLDHYSVSLCVCVSVCMYHRFCFMIYRTIEFEFGAMLHYFFDHQQFFYCLANE